MLFLLLSELAKIRIYIQKTRDCIFGMPFLYKFKQTTFISLRICLLISIVVLN